jgi:hypothetical protein
VAPCHQPAGSSTGGQFTACDSTANPPVKAKTSTKKKVKPKPATTPANPTTKAKKRLTLKEINQALEGELDPRINDFDPYREGMLGFVRPGGYIKEDGFINPSPDVNGFHPEATYSKPKSKREQWDVSAYTYAGMVCGGLNGVLRNNDDSWQEHNRINDRMLENIQDVCKRHTVPKGSVLHRRVGDIQTVFHTDNPQDLVGAVFTEKGFVSTTTKKSATFDGLKLRITASEGTRGAYIAPISGYDLEEEVLLPSGTTFEVTEWDGKVLHVRTVPEAFDESHFHDAVKRVREHLDKKTTRKRKLDS